MKEVYRLAAYNAAMLIERIDHVQVAVPSLEAAVEPFQRLGLALTPLTRHRGTGTANTVFFAGEGAAEFYAELLGVADEQEAAASASGQRVMRQLAGGGGLRRVLFAVRDMGEAVEGLTAKSVAISPYDVFADDGRKISVAAALPDDGPGFEAALVEYPEALLARRERHARAGLFGHAFPLKRLDHLAAITHDLEGATRWWAEVMGAAVVGEIVTPGVIIRQLRIGDAILELLAAPSPSSPIASRPAGLASLVAFEVDDLDDAVALARDRGFNPSAPEAGVIPGTRRATIPAAELAGLSLQLLAYV